MERETGFEPATLALARLFRLKGTGPVFRNFFISSRFPVVYLSDTFYENREICRSTSTNLAQSIDPGFSNRTRKVGR